MVTAVDAAEIATPITPRRGGLWRYILIRLLLIIPTVVILVTVVFVLMRVTGDPITAALGGRLPPTSWPPAFTRPATIVPC